ncbi:diguanylate cyclase [bacterium]|nr:diguanylate cyclase [bacterium]
MNTVLLHTKKQQLMSVLADRFYRQEKNTELMVDILGHAVECRSGEGGTHMTHVILVTGLLLQCPVGKTDRYHLEREDIEAIRVASGLHDIGKLQIPEEILTKPLSLTPEEYEIVKRHTQIGAKLITDLPIYQNERLVKYAIEICRWHHERWNGEGYPDGLKGDAIPIAAQVVSVADVYDALTSERCYKEALSHEKSMRMIHSGECGSFNPLLLECLDEIAVRLQKELSVVLHLDQGHSEARRTVEELYASRSEDSTTRVAIQLEEERGKRQFFSELTDELWFEYTTNPDAIALSASASKRTGLPKVVVDLAGSADFLAVVGTKTLDEIRGWAETATIDETYFETGVEIRLDGAMHWCKLAIMVTWSSTEAGRYNSLLGIIRDIDKSYRHLSDVQQALPHESAQALTPMMSGTADDVLHVSKEQVDGLLAGYRRIFDIARLVDPGICVELTKRDEGYTLKKSEHCYAVWKKKRRCENCISQEVLRTHKPQTKLKTRASDVYYVLASFVEVDGRPYSLELVKRIKSDDMFECENVLNQLLVRNRQVYMDSVTKVYNRRYYDERLNNLEGRFSFAMIDMDNFKHINDRFGHQAGDAALYRAAQAIKSQIRSDDELVRYGGDEFFLLFRDLPQQILEKKLQSIRAALDEIVIEEYPELHISASIGGAFAAGRISRTIRRADLAMYQAKLKKDCVAIYREAKERET